MELCGERTGLMLQRGKYPYLGGDFQVRICGLAPMGALSLACTESSGMPSASVPASAACLASAMASRVPRLMLQRGRRVYLGGKTEKEGSGAHL